MEIIIDVDFRLNFWCLDISKWTLTISDVENSDLNYVFKVLQSVPIL